MPNLMHTEPKRVAELLRKGKLLVAEIGLGRMGLPIACLYAQAGAKVVGVDPDRRVVREVAKGRSPFQEPGLQRALSIAVSRDRLDVFPSPSQAPPADIYLITVPTTLTRDGKPDYEQVRRAGVEIGRKNLRGALVILQSTVAPGVTEGVLQSALEGASSLAAGADFGLAYSPLRASSGRILQDLKSYNRLVGGINEESRSWAAEVISFICKGGVRRMSGIRAAEAAKLFENVYRDVNIALANELAGFCEAAGLDYYEISSAANSQPFCHLHRPGIVGGKCIPVNPHFLIEKGRRLGARVRLVEYSRKLNQTAAERAARWAVRAVRAAHPDLRRPRVLLLGASFKANVKEDGLSPSSFLYPRFRRLGWKVQVWDPYFDAAELRRLGYEVPDYPESALKEYECIVLTVAHEELKRLKPTLFAFGGRKRVVVDITGAPICRPEDSTDKVACMTLGVG